MKSRASLVVIEQAVMLLVFALAAALCVKAFVWADTESEDLWERDKALLQAQNAAELIKSSRGDMQAAAGIMGGEISRDEWVVLYDENWQPVSEGGAYMLIAAPAESGLRYMGSARVEVYENERQLAALDIAWQEVSGDEG